jgi:beta-glucanase (GH16 family)
MFTHLFAIAALGLLLVGCEPAPQPSSASPRPSEWPLVWSDEFDGPTLNFTKWGIPSYKERADQQVNTPGTASVKDGYLHLTAFEKNGRLHGPIIDSKAARLFRYGWFEARMKMHRLRGHHASFWLQSPLFRKGTDDPSLFGTEMDVIEWFGPGRRQGWAGMNIYFNGKDKVERSPSLPDFTRIGGPSPNAPEAPLLDLGAAFHTYALRWTPTECCFYIDDVEIKRDSQTVSHTGEFIVLSLLSSGWERRLLDFSQLPDSAVVDYVRVYQDPAWARTVSTSEPTPSTRASSP